MEPLRVVPLRRPWLWLASALVAAALAALAVSLWRNPHIDHAAIARFQFAPAILQGLRMTVVLALLAAVIGATGGVLLAVMRLSRSPVSGSRPSPRSPHVCRCSWY